MPHLGSRQMAPQNGHSHHSLCAEGEAQPIFVEWNIGFCQVRQKKPQFTAPRRDGSFLFSANRTLELGIGKWIYWTALSWLNRPCCFLVPEKDYNKSLFLYEIGNKPKDTFVTWHSSANWKPADQKYLQARNNNSHKTKKWPVSQRKIHHGKRGKRHENEHKWHPALCQVTKKNPIWIMTTQSGFFTPRL